jgi:two-component system phosphate regulon sensor histidine kinase PhoR
MLGAIAMARRRFWPSFFRWLLLLAAAATLGGYLFQGQLENRLQELLEEENLRVARLAARLIEPMEDLQSGVTDLAHECDARVTVVDDTGRVLAESDRNPESMENHRDRPEILAAERDGCGHAVRRSATLGTEMLYTALRIDKSRHVAGKMFVRLARPRTRVDEMTMSFSELVWRTVPLGILAAVLGVCFIAERRMAQ